MHQLVDILSGMCEESLEKTYYSGPEVDSSPSQQEELQSSPGCQSSCKASWGCQAWSWDARSEECKLLKKVKTVAKDTVSGNICRG